MKILKRLLVIVVFNYLFTNYQENIIKWHLMILDL
jgi:hypothetical protein